MSKWVITPSTRFSNFYLSSLFTFLICFLCFHETFFIIILIYLLFWVKYEFSRFPSKARGYNRTKNNRKAKGKLGAWGLGGSIIYKCVFLFLFSPERTPNVLVLYRNGNNAPISSTCCMAWLWITLQRRNKWIKHK